MVYYEKLARPYALFSIISYLLNLKIIKSPLVHVYCVQFPLFLGLEKYLLSFAPFMYRRMFRIT